MGPGILPRQRFVLEQKNEWKLGGVFLHGIDWARVKTFVVVVKGGCGADARLYSSTGGLKQEACGFKASLGCTWHSPNEGQCVFSTYGALPTH